MKMGDKVLNKPRLVGVIDEDPFDPLTWSGSSKFFFEALQRQGILLRALSADPGALIKKCAQAISFSPNLKRWKRKYNLNPFLFHKMGKRVIERLSLMDDNFDGTIQVGAWYNFTYSKELKGKFFCSYHDGNLATQIKRPDSPFNTKARYVKKAFQFEKQLYQRLDIIFPMSKWLCKSFVEDFGCDPDKVIPVGAGINMTNVPKISKKDYSKPNILFIGIDFIRKGGKVLLDAFKIVREEIPNAKLTIIGPELTGLSEGIVSLGRILKNSPEGEKELQDAYLNATIFVMPSFYEPFGIVFAEAMAHKLPCIGTNVCAMPEIIDEDKTGFIVPIGNSRLLAYRIIDLLRNEKELQKFGEAGYTKVLKNFTWKRVAQKIAANISYKL